MLRLQPSFDGSVEASHPHVKDHDVYCRAFCFRWQGRALPHQKGTRNGVVASAKKSTRSGR
jgi:hypothetical protein